MDKKSVINKIRRRLFSYIEHRETFGMSEGDAKINDKKIANPYDNFIQYKPIKVTKINKSYTKDMQTKFTLITPIKNEAIGIIEFIKSVENQSQRPDEFLIVDGGSTDDTVDIINNYIVKSELNIKLFQINSKSISEQRNLAIQNARNEHIVLADAGNILDVNYCRNMIGVFEEYTDVDLVGAIYYALHKECEKYFIYNWDTFEGWDQFLPAGKTMAIKKSIALQVGGFPEYLSYAGEDALFGINYRKASKHWIINTAAFVHWDIPRTQEDTFKKFKAYGKGGGEAAIDDFRFYPNLINARKYNIYNPELIILDALFQGYLTGRDRKAFIEFELRNVEGLDLVISDSHLDKDSQLLEIVQDSILKNRKVILVSSLKESRKPVYLDIDYTLLELYNDDDFSIEDLWRRYGVYRDKINFINLVRSNISTDMQNIENTFKNIKSCY